MMEKLDVQQCLTRYIGQETEYTQYFHIELYCIGPDTFIRRHEEQNYTHNLLPEGTEKPVVWGYELICKAFV